MQVSPPIASGSGGPASDISAIRLLVGTTGARQSIGRGIDGMKLHVSIARFISIARFRLAPMSDTGTCDHYGNYILVKLIITTMIVPRVYPFL